MMDHVRPLGSDVGQVALVSWQVGDIVLGTEGIVHVEEVDYEVPGSYVAPGNQDGGPRREHKQFFSMQAVRVCT